MARIIISGELHNSIADRKKHMTFYSQVDVIFLEDRKGSVQQRTDILYPLFLLFCKLWLSGLRRITKKFPKDFKNLKSYDVDMTLLEIYNSVGGKTKIGVFIGLLLLLGFLLQQYPLFNLFPPTIAGS